MTENVNGVNVFHVRGHFTHHTDITLLGVAPNFYDVVRVDPNNLMIRLKSGIAMDAEDPHYLEFIATNGDSTQSIFRTVSPDVLNVDEATIFTPDAPNIAGADNAFMASGGSVFTYDFSKDFFDPEGDITGYQLVTAPSHAELNSYSFDTATGLLTMNFDSVIAAHDSFNFAVKALSTSNDVTHSYTFELKAQSTSSSTITVMGEVYTGTDASITVAADSVTVFSDQDATANTVNVSGDYAYVKVGDGDDSITVNPAMNDYRIYTEDGHDSFHLYSAYGKAYGGDGNDAFHLKSNAAINDLEIGSPSGTKIDGGFGHDKLHIDTTGTIDFSLVNTGVIRNMEKISTVNGGANTVFLDYNSVIDMTEHDNTLIVKLDAADTLNFDNTTSNLFVQEGQETVGGVQYDIFTDGTVTLLINTDAGTVNWV